MTFKDFQHIQHYFTEEEKRDPSVTEIRVLDTYWSDHCRHTTFSTELKEVKIDEGDYKAPIEKTYQQYVKDHQRHLRRSRRQVYLPDGSGIDGDAEAEKRRKTSGSGRIG